MRILTGKGALFAAIALGALTAGLTWNLVNQAKPGQVVAETRPVVVANAPIGVRTVITPQLVRVQQMPLDAIHPQTISSTDQVIGKVARIAMTGDEPVLTTKVFLQRGESGLAFMVPEGMRAVSVNFSEVVGTGGMVTPGDHVDVVGVFQAARDEARAAQNARPGQNAQTRPTTSPAANSDQDDEDEKISLATIVLQDVEVLAVAQRLEGEVPAESRGSSLPGLSSSPSGKAAESQRAEATPQPAAKTATVAVTPEDALKLVLAEEKGKIRLALRRNKDTDRPEVPQVPMTALLTPAR
jgi:pilus assembly protein CpaB